MIGEPYRTFIESRDMFFLATVDGDGRPQCSYKGGEPGFVRVRGEAVFANCKRYVHHYALVERSRFVPSAAAPAPVPDWKLDPWFEGMLPAGDAAHDPLHPSAPAMPEF